MATKINYSYRNDARSTPATSGRGGEEIAFPQKIIVLHFITMERRRVKERNPDDKTEII